MKSTFTKASLVTILALASISIPTYANSSINEQDTSHTDQTIGLGAGTVVGGIVAGPIGMIAGGLIGSLVGQNVADENHKMQLRKTNQNLNNQLVESSEKIKSLENTSSHQNIVLKDAHLTIEKLLSQNQELKNHVLNFDVQFRTNSTEIEKQYQEYLIRLAHALNETPYIELEISGFADRMGDEDYNMMLSSKRAQKVKTFLIQQGIEENRITTLAHGETQPLHPQESLENNFFDRRVSVYIRPNEVNSKNIANEIVAVEDELSVATNERESR